MTLEQILSETRALTGVLELAPQLGSEHPEVSWGDYFFYYAPDGRVPRNRQPFATIVTKDYPEDAESELDAPDRWRLNIHLGSSAFVDLLGFRPEHLADMSVDFSQVDVFLPHPVYGAYGWVAVVNPGLRTIDRALQAVRDAHTADRHRVERRG